MLFKADPDISYGRIADVVGSIRSAGVEIVGLVTGVKTVAK